MSGKITHLLPTSLLCLLLIACGSEHNPVVNNETLPIASNYTTCSNEVSTNTTGYDSRLIRPDHYTQVFCDEFSSGSQPDSTKWTYDLGSPLLGGTVWGNDEKQHYTSDIDNIYISSGNLYIQAKQGKPAGSASSILASSARLKSETTSYYDAIGNTPYGYYEVRANISCTNGSWPAIWLLGKERNWPSRGEIDIMEWSQLYDFSDTYSVAIHTQDNNGGNYKGASFNYSKLCQRFHKYQLHWSKDKLVMGINGQYVFTYDRPNNATINNWPYDQPAYILLNVAVGGNLGGSVDANTINDMKMIVDYVRVWINSSTDTTIIDNSSAYVQFPISFEDTQSPYTIVDFSGGVATHIINPHQTGINTSAKVLKMLKNKGDTWGGSYLDFKSVPINFSSGTLLTMKVWSQRAVKVLLKLEAQEASINSEVELSHTGSGWENLSFDFTGETSVFDNNPTRKLVIIFDNGTMGNYQNSPTDWLFYIDDIMQPL